MTDELECLIEAIRADVAAIRASIDGLSGDVGALARRIDHQALAFDRVARMVRRNAPNAPASR